MNKKSEQHFKEARKLYFLGSILMMLLPPLGVITLIHANDEWTKGKYYKMQEDSIELMGELRTTYNDMLNEAQRFTTATTT